MAKWVLLLRGINVGGNNILPMKGLKRILEQAGFANPVTYIQSGNCVFETDRLDPAEMTEDINRGIETEFGFSPKLMFLSQEQFEQAINSNPYPEGVDEPKTVHFYFLSEPALAYTEDTLLAVKKDSESYCLIGDVFYLHATEGIGRSKLVTKVERALGVPGTGRNFRTVMKIAEMLTD